MKQPGRMGEQAAQPPTNRHEQHSNQQIQQYEPRQEIVKAPAPSTLAGMAKNRIIHKFGMTEQQWIVYDAEVSIGLLTLRTAFPTQARNYSDREHDMLTALWLEIFAEIEPGTLREAIMRFIAADRKGFFPAPGQIMGIVEEIIDERKKQATAEQAERHYAYLRELQRRIDNGENCSTCRFCEHRKVEKSYWRRDDTNDKTEIVLFCQNPESYKFEGDGGYGTAARILCEYYEPQERPTDGRGGLIDAASDG